MKKIFLIAFTIISVQIAAAKNIFIFSEEQHSMFAKTDTNSEDIVKEDAMIEEVIKSRTAPKKEKIQYFNQVTKYGFKNLFSNYSYNPSLPYTSQVNPQAEMFIQDYMKSHGSYLEKMKGWGKPYFNLIENVLQEYGLPKELKYIAVIESSLQTGATSYAGAGGPWQFMPGTAKRYGLIVNGYIDERRDYYKSSHAAARYLLTLYRDLHDWLLVMAAYNGGPGRVYTAIKKSGSRNFWDLQYYLPEESRIYVKRFIATHYIMEGTGGVTTFVNNSEESGQSNIRTNYGSNTPRKNPYSTSTLQPSDSTLAEISVLPVSGKYNSLVIAKNLSMDISLFNHYNPGFDEKLSATGSTDIRLPNDKMQLFITNKFSILNECIQVLLGSTTMPAATKTTYQKEGKKSNKSHN